MAETFDIAGYCRISVDTEQDRESTSIENQKNIIEKFVKDNFQGSSLHLFEDRDRSGYTFEQRENYMTMRRELLERRHSILIVKDFSRFSRRNSRGLVELEDLRDAGIRIISIDDNVDYPGNDDWLKIQFQFLINEMPVTDASKKVKSVINARQQDGKWICALPYGYEMINSKQMTFKVDEAAAEVVRKIFGLYIQGWGYKKIANHLTDLSIPTPRMSERDRKEARGEECRLTVRPQWSIVTVQGILENDFYIGTLRQRKYSRKRIKGADVKLDESEHRVFENHHEAIISPRTFAIAGEQRKKRSTTHYRGVKKYDNTYSGFLICGDCGAPMFSMSRPNLKPAYTCGTYHKRGLKGCTSHHTRVDMLDGLLKSYIRRVRDNSSRMIATLEAAIKNEKDALRSNEDAQARLEALLAEAREELKATKRQKIREISRKPGQERAIEELYDEMEAELEHKIAGLQSQISMAANRRNTIIKVNRVARNAIDIFDAILDKDKLSKADLELIIDKIVVYEDHIEIKLMRDIDSLLALGGTEDASAEPDSVTVNFSRDTEDIALPVAAGAEPRTIVQSSPKHEDKVFRVNVISNGDPLEIYTDKDGEVIFKKYSPMGELSSFSNQICETLNKTTGCTAAVTDRDIIISISGNGNQKRDLFEKRISEELERIMESRQVFQYKQGEAKIPVSEGQDKLYAAVAAPILAEGDVSGCVVFVADDESAPLGDTEYKLAQTVAGFLGKQMES